MAGVAATGTILFAGNAQQKHKVLTCKMVPVNVFPGKPGQPPIHAATVATKLVHTIKCHRRTYQSPLKLMATHPQNRFDLTAA